MAVNIGQLHGTIDLDDKFSAKLGKAQSAFKSFGKVALGATVAITAAAAAAGVALAIFAKKSLDAAVEAEESENLFQESFSGMADAARKWSIETSQALGLNEFEIRRQAATLFVMTESMGVASERAYEMATSLTILAGDMASFYNLPHEIAFKKLQGVITGEVEGLKTLGIVLKNTVIKEVALRNGILKVGEQMSEQIKIQARYLAIMEQTIKSQGDLARTIDSPANAQRVLNSQMDQFMIVMGRSLIPAYRGWIAANSAVLQLLVRNQQEIKAFVRSALAFLVDAIQAVIFAFRGLNSWIATTRRGFEFIALGAKTAGEALILLERIAEAPLLAAYNWQQFKDRVAEHTITTSENIRKINKQEKAVEDVSLAIGTVINNFRETLLATEGVTDSTVRFVEKLDDLEEGTKEVTEATQKWNELLKDMEKNSMQMMADETRKLREEQEKLVKALEAQLALEVEESYNRMREEAEKLADEAQRLKDVKLEGMFTGIVLVAGLVSDDLAGMAQVIENVSESFKNATTNTEKFYAAASAVGQIGGLLGGKLGGVLQGAAGGASMGMMFGPWGAAIGGVIGGIAGLFSSSVESSVNDMRDAFLEAHDGWESLQGKLAEITDQDLVRQIFDARTVEEFESAVNAVNMALNTQVEAEKALDDAIKRYGFSIEELGPAYARQELDKKAAQLLQDYKLLVASGIDVNTVISKMGPNLNEFVQQSLAAGQAIPEAMRPVIEQMIAAGLLLDENGKAYASVEDAGITFAQTMSEQFQSLIEKIDQMVNALLGIGNVRIPPIHVPIIPTYPNGVPGGSQASEIPEMAAGGIVTRPTVALIGEAGPEAIIPLGQNSSASFLEELRGIRNELRELPNTLRRAQTAAAAFAR